MLRAYTLTFAGCALITLAVSTIAPAAAAPGRATPSLAGTWRVSRTCVSGCAGSTTVLEVVRPYAPHVFMARGGLTLVLYQIGNQVLVHGAKASSLLTIRIPGQLMSGSSVGANGSTLTTAWRCVAAPAPTSTTSASGARMAGITGKGPQGVPGARARC
jgi:hypothetical protein